MYIKDARQSKDVNNQILNKQETILLKLKIVKNEQNANTIDVRNQDSFYDSHSEIVASETMDINTNILHTHEIVASKSLSLTKMVIIYI